MATQAEYNRRWREKNPDRDREYRSRYFQENKEQIYAYRAERARLCRAFVDEQKAGKPCVECGGTFPPAAMQWHHIDPSTKTADVSRLAANRRALDVIQAEIDKCELLCANCHYVRHFEERQEHEAA